MYKDPQGGIRIPAGRAYFDRSKVTISKTDGSEFQLMNKWSTLNEATGKKWSDFTPTKKEFVEHMCKFLHKMKQRGHSN